MPSVWPFGGRRSVEKKTEQTIKFQRNDLSVASSAGISIDFIFKKLFPLKFSHSFLNKGHHTFGKIMGYAQ